MNYIAWFKDLNKDSIPVAGGKGANLGEMYNLGLPVPPGFCVTAQTYKEFIERTQIKEKIEDKLKGLDINDTEKLQEVAKKIQNIINYTEIPGEMAEDILDSYELLGAGKDAHDLVESKDVFVAVRSSATAEDLPSASFAGQQATFLNVKGKQEVINAVRSCWASLYTARAIYYREKNGFDHSKVLICAVVQRMVNSDKSGIMFTINPATNKEDEIVIEAVYGLGEMIVGGEVNPDMYVINKTTKEITKTEVRKQEIGLFRNEKGENEKQDVPDGEQEQQIVSDLDIKELARLGKKIEDHYGRPQDIEWAMEKEKIYIVQARAVTTFHKEEEAGEEVKSEINGAQGTQETNEPNVPSGTNEFTEPKTHNIILKGETASRGVYGGKVKLVNDPSELSKIVDGDVLVTKMTTPDMVPAMQKAGAIITNEGGMTCHAAIVSREMGTPCIVGTRTATESLQDGQEVTVDATNGIVYEGFLGTGKKRESGVTEVVEETQKEPVVHEDIITATEVKVIMDLPDMAQRAAQTGADGVGLVRLEIMIANGGIHPAEYIRQDKDADYVNLLKTGIRKIAQAFAHKPVWVRCSDMRSDEYRNLQGGEQESHESDPMIGWHAIRRLLDEPRILKAEFQAIKELHEEGFDNVGVMLPFVIRVEEVKKAKEVMREMGLEPCQDVDFGVMIETPASCWIIEELCQEGISFVSFGTNDLTQLTLGIDRNNERIAHLFDEMHPAVLGELAKVIDVCNKYKVTSSICGQAGSRPEMAEFLVHRGINSISANVDAVDEIRHTVAKTEKKLLLDAERERKK